HIKAGSVSPVTVTFRINAIRSVILHGQGNGVNTPVNDLSRQFGIVFVYSHGSVAHTGIAYLIPVVFNPEPAVIFWIEGGLDALFQNGFLNDGSALWR